MNVENVEQLLARLNELDKESPTWVADFEAGLFALPDDIRPFFVRLIALFDDEVPYDAAMFSLVHLIEKLETSAYVAHILEAMPVFVRQSPRWSSIVVMRILNAPATSKAMSVQVKTATADEKEAVAWLLGAINKRSSEFDAKTRPVLEALASSQGAHKGIGLRT